MQSALAIAVPPTEAGIPLVGADNDEPAWTDAGPLLAAAVADRLQALIAAAERTQDEASGSSLHLQERLRLAAQMLEAFEIQISRVEASARELGEREASVEQAGLRLQECLKALERRAEAITARAAQRIEQAADAVATRFGKQLSATLAVSAEQAKAIHHLNGAVGEARLRLAADVARLSRTLGTAASALERDSGGDPERDSPAGGSGERQAAPRNGPPQLRLRPCADEG